MNDSIRGFWFPCSEQMLYPCALLKMNIFYPTIYISPTKKKKKKNKKNVKVW
jgi:hypothetical protein